MKTIMALVIAVLLTGCGSGGAATDKQTVANSPSVEQLFVQSLEGIWSANDLEYCDKVNDQWVCTQSTQVLAACGTLANARNGIAYGNGGGFMLMGSRMIDWQQDVTFADGALHINPFGFVWPIDMIDSYGFYLTTAPGCTQHYEKTGDQGQPLRGSN